MRTSCVKNGLVVATILLFIGVAIQPAIAVNPISSDNEEDCDICPKVSNLHLVRLKSLLTKVEKLNNKLSVISKLKPKVAEKYQELSDIIETYIEVNYELKPNILGEDNLTICFILYLIYSIRIFSFWSLLYTYSYFQDYPVLNLLFSPLFFILGTIHFTIDSIIMDIGMKKNCKWVLSYG